MRLQDIVEIANRGQVQGVLLRSGGWIGDRMALVRILLEVDKDLLRLEEWRFSFEIDADDKDSPKANRVMYLNRTIYAEPETVLGVTLRPSPISLPEGFRFPDEE